MIAVLEMTGRVFAQMMQTLRAIDIYVFYRNSLEDALSCLPFCLFSPFFSANHHHEHRIEFY
jgi:hypothetical protein